MVGYMGEYFTKQKAIHTNWTTVRVRNTVLWSSIIVAFMTLVRPERAFAAIDYRDTLYRDTLEKAVGPPGDINIDAGQFFDVFAADQESFDNNLYRLPSGSDVASVVGPNASREDHINTSSVGLDGQWTPGRQFISLNLRADDNRYARNTDLNNISGRDSLEWNWVVGDLLSGLVGADYNRYLASFVNTSVYTLNMVDQTEYFGGARYQIGPRWAVFGGILQTNTSLTAVASKVNDNDVKSAELGMEYATGVQNSVGWEYRHTNASYPNTSASAGTVFYPNFTEDRARLFVKYTISDKTQIDASAGFLKRDYSSHAIGAFSGDVWRASLQWQPRDKLQFLAVAWRELHAYLTADTDYFVSNGASISPVWIASEKINVSFLLSKEKQNYIGSDSGTPGGGTRQDNITAEVASITYTPVRYLILNSSIRHEQHASNEAQFEFTDTLILVGVTVKF
jgi:hypothetical protein